MLLVKTKIKESEVHGIGLFADQFISKGTEIWRFTQGFDQKFTREQILGFPDLLQIYIYKYCWRSKKSKLYCFSADNGKYFNHSKNQNVLSEYRHNEEEVVTIAIKDIEIGEEILDDYSSFEDEKSEKSVLDEIAEKFELKDELDPRFKLLSIKEKNHMIKI
jgi:SET domain-containing protein